MNLAFNRMKAENGGNAPKLHQILAALSIMLSRDENLSKIFASHPCLRKHIHYDSSIVFPSEISDLLPKQEKRWWDLIPVNLHQVDSPPPPIPAGGSLIPAGDPPLPAGGSPLSAGNPPSPQGESSHASGPRDPVPQEEDVPMPPHSPAPFVEQQTAPMEVEDGEEEEEDELAEEEDALIEPRSVRPKVSGCKFVTPSILTYKSVGAGQRLGRL